MSKKKHVQRFIDYPVIMSGKDLHDMGIYKDKHGYLIPTTSQFYVWLEPGVIGLQATNECGLEPGEKKKWDKLVDKYSKLDGV